MTNEQHGAKHLARIEKRALALEARMQASPNQADFADEVAELKSIKWLLNEFRKAKSPAAQGAVAVPYEYLFQWYTAIRCMKGLMLTYPGKFDDELAEETQTANDTMHALLSAHPAPAGEHPVAPISDLAMMLRRMIYQIRKRDVNDDSLAILASKADDLLRLFRLQGSPLREPAAPAAPNATPRRKICISPLATRALLYSDTLGGEQVCSDDMWAVTTDELNALTRELAAVVAPTKVGMPERPDLEALTCTATRDADFGNRLKAALVITDYADALRAHIAQGKGE